LAKTLVDGLNDVLKKVDVLDNDTELTSLSDPARQTQIDTALQAINETVDRLFALPRMPTRPNQVSERVIVLNTDDQDYELHETLVRLLPEFGLIDETNNHVITILPGPDAYRQLVIGDLEQNDTGLPSLCAIRPTDGQLWMDRAPTAEFDGREYKYRFEKDMGLTEAGDLFPFSDPVYRGVVLAAAELWNKENTNRFSEKFFNAALAQAAGRLSIVTEKHTWLDKQRIVPNPTDPFVHD
jgi:hypothetical protein